MDLGRRYSDSGSLIYRQKWVGFEWPPGMETTLQAGLSDLLQFAG